MVNKIVLGDNQEVREPSPAKLERLGSASSALTEKRDNSTNRERIIKDKDNIEKFFKEK